MLYDCMQIFMKKSEKVHSESLRNDADTDMELINKFTIDSYIPSSGMYILINLDDNFSIQEPLNIIVNAKTGEVIGRTDCRYQYIRYLDYNSKLVAMNKPIKPKSIHSNNMYSFFVKKDSLLNGELTISIVDEYYDTLANPRKKYKKRNGKELYQKVESEVGDINIAILEKIRIWIKKWIQDPSILPYDIMGKGYFKIFFVYQNEKKTKEIYERENRRYIIPNIYNSNDYNLTISNEILGLPNNNRSFNSKKIFLQNKTRKTITPYLVNMEDVIWQNRFFDYLYGQASIGNVNIYFDFDKEEIYTIPDKDDPPYIDSGLYLRIKKGKEVEIIECDTLFSLNPNLQPTFYYKSIIEGKSDIITEGECNKRGQLAAVIDEIFFGKMLAYNYFTEPEALSITDSVIENILLTYRGRLFEWLYRNPRCNIRQTLTEMSGKLIQNTMQNGYKNKARQQINLALSLLDYLNQDTRMEKMMKIIQEEFRKHMGMYKEEWAFGSDEEYYYAVGQLVDYFLSLSKSAKKPLSLVNPFLAAKDDVLIKEKLSQMFEKYNYAIDSIVDVRAKNIISHVMLYIPETKVQKQYLIAGLTASSAFYMKKEEDK